MYFRYIKESYKTENLIIQKGMGKNRALKILVMGIIAESAEGFNEQYLGYFKESGIEVTSVEYLGSGEYSKTFKVRTKGRDYALNVRNEGGGNYRYLVGEDNIYLPEVFDVREVLGKLCIVMELLFPISADEKMIIDCIDYLFYQSGDDGLDVWLEDNLNQNLYYKTQEIIEDIDIDYIEEKQYIEKLKWFRESFEGYENFIEDIQSAFQEYSRKIGGYYTDFHGDNLMKDKYGSVKLIDL